MSERLTVKYKAYPGLGSVEINAEGFNPDIHELLTPPVKRRGRPRKVEGDTNANRRKRQTRI